MKTRTLLLMCILPTILCTSANARIIHVDSAGSGGFSNIQAAIDDAGDGDTVVMAPGNYTGSGNRDINFKAKAITVRSTDPNDPAIVESTVIDCQGNGRAFIFVNGEQADSILEGITIIHGQSDYGGGIFISNSSPTIAKCRISDCSGVNPLYLLGGAVYIFDGNPVIEGCTISGNAVFFDGAGICCEEGSPMIRNSIIENNQAGWGDGSGIYYSGSGKPSIINCTIRGNSAQQPVENGGRTVRSNGAGRGGSGGGIYILGGQPTVDKCSIIDNIAGLGGGLYIHDSSPFISHCSIEDNSAVGGGGLYFGCQGWPNTYTFRLEHCRISGNSANSQAGGISTRLCRLAMSNCIVSGNRLLYGGAGGGLNIGPFTLAEIEQCTIVGNQVNEEAPGIDCFGGGLYLMMCNVRIANSIIRQNHATKGSQITVNAWDGVQSPDEPPLDEPTLVTLHHNDLALEQDRQVYIYGEPNRLTLEMHSNQDVDPLFANPGHWADANNPNIFAELNDPNASWIEGDYHLKSQAGRFDPNMQSWVQDEVTSPCIDAGDPNSPVGYEPFPNGGYVNMGAYGGTSEASKSYFGQPLCETIIAGDINGDCKVDQTDWDILMLHWLEDNSPQN